MCAHRPRLPCRCAVAALLADRISRCGLQIMGQRERWGSAQTRRMAWWVLKRRARGGQRRLELVDIRPVRALCAVRVIVACSSGESTGLEPVSAAMPTRSSGVALCRLSVRFRLHDPRPGDSCRTAPLPVVPVQLEGPWPSRKVLPLGATCAPAGGSAVRGECSPQTRNRVGCADPACLSRRRRRPCR